MDDVAREAGVARATVYEHFGTKPRLLGALVEMVARESALPLDDAARAPDPVAATRIIVQHAGSHWDRHARRIREAQETAAFAAKAAGGVMPADVDHAALRDLADRLFRGGHLRPPWTAVEAAAALGVLTSFETFNRLRGGLDVAVIGTVLGRMADAMLASSAGPAG